ncbi:hypothetical protein CXB51_032066 [Gossypium anomalum]|uniref:Uncharacterized protein n=1 Tax=Gossypium anomalum TaxID=47600 RepID=A0A8J5XS24_9ROSI|nr:hypothetical protein CXB51_032066 [Gossypium anomalum]
MCICIKCGCFSCKNTSGERDENGGAADCVDIMLAILLPPAGIYKKEGCTGRFWANVVLTVLGIAPGSIHASGRVAKPNAQWTIAEEKLADTNFKALCSIFYGLDLHEFKRISKCIVAKSAWDILEATHDVNSTVKQLKMQLQTSRFERLGMWELETIEDYYAKLCDLSNQAFLLGG